MLFTLVFSVHVNQLDSKHVLHMLEPFVIVLPFTVRDCLGGHLGQHNVMGGEPRAFVGKRGTDCMCILVLHSLCHFKGFLVCFDFLICQGRGTALPSMTYTESPKPVTRRLTTCFENASPDTVQVVVLSSSHI